MFKTIMPQQTQDTKISTSLIDEYYIDDAAALTACCAMLSNSTWLALDTEFIRDSTYYPQLCLLQISNGTIAACIDPLALDTIAALEPLLDILYNPQIVKVWHAARQDLEIFQHRWNRIPTPLFDTQLAAGILQYGSQIGYANLVKQCLDIDLPKDQTRTDWAARPLGEQQIRYALDDVVYLGTVYQQLQAVMTTAQHQQLDKQQTVLLEPETYAPEPANVWRKIKGRKLLRGAQQRTLQALAAWRENQARRHNLPRKWLMTDQDMVNICRTETP